MCFFCLDDFGVIVVFVLAFLGFLTEMVVVGFFFSFFAFEMLGFFILGIIFDLGFLGRLTPDIAHRESLY